MTRRLICTLVLFACLAVGLICVAYPIYVIRPFRHQGAANWRWRWQSADSGR
jgi:hypothetical protein